MMDPNLPRHLMSSLSELFSGTAGTLGINFFVEGIDEDERDDFTRNGASFRMNGPFIYEGSGYSYAQIEIQILLTSLTKTTAQNPYSIYDWAGAFYAVMEGNLTIYDYGDGTDDPIPLGCLIPEPGVKAPVRIVNYGQVDRTSRVCQMSVNGKFILEL